MYTTIRRYDGFDPTTVEGIIQRVESGFLPIVSAVEGFISFRYIVLGRKPLIFKKLVPAQTQLMRMTLFSPAFFCLLCLNMTMILICYVSRTELCYRLCSRISLLFSGCFFVRSTFSLSGLLFLLSQHRTQTLYVTCHHRHGNIAFKSVETVIGTFVQTVDFKGVDRRFHR